MVLRFLSLVLINMHVQAKIRSRTTALGKRGQIVGYAALRMSLKTISATTNIPISTCSDTIRLSKLRRAYPHALQDPCASWGIKSIPNCKKGKNQILSHAQKQLVIAVA